MNKVDLVILLSILNNIEKHDEMRGTMRSFKRIITLSLFFLLAGCAQTESKAESTDRLKVVATTTMLTDLVNEIGGDAVEVEGLMGPGIDFYGY